MTSTAERPDQELRPHERKRSRSRVRNLWLHLFFLSIAAMIASAVTHQPLVVLIMVLALWIVVTLTTLALAAGLRPPRPLTEQSLLANQIAWLWRLMFGAATIGISAFVAVGAQADFDAHRADGYNGQIHALANACFGLLGQILLLGATILGVRIGWAIWRIGALGRYRTVWRATGALGLRGEARALVSQGCVVLTHPLAVGVVLYLTPSIIWTSVLVAKGGS